MTITLDEDTVIELLNFLHERGKRLNVNLGIDSRVIPDLIHFLDLYTSSHKEWEEIEASNLKDDLCNALENAPFIE